MTTGARAARGAHGSPSRQTIFALSSGRPPAAIGIIRVSGEAAGATLEALAGRPVKPRRPSLVRLRRPETQEPLDDALVLWFPGPATATGEDLLELHCHGGRAVIAAVEETLRHLPGLRAAEPGEFTRRALENGRIDLTQAEGLADLLSAETESQRRAALAMSEGHFSRRIGDWERRLLQLSAMVEAALDFSDEDDVPDEGIEARIQRDVAALLSEVEGELARPAAERLRQGINVVIAGPPNAGKSTLLNCLAGRDAAIVSDIAGTTRDRVEVPVALAGIPFLLTDTAGLREAGVDSIEAIGIERARRAMDQADILLWLGDADMLPRADALLLAAQIDRPERRGVTKPGLPISALSGEGMSALIDTLLQRARELLPTEGDYALGERQRQALAVLAGVLAAALESPDMLIVAEELRSARRALDRLTGRAGTEEMLDLLFAGFCIGK